MPRSRVPLALLALLAGIVSACALRGPANPTTAAVGVYEARLPAADAAGRIVTLWLEPDDVATLDVVYVGKGRAPVLRGRWSVRADELTVDLKNPDGTPRAPLVYTVDADRLVPKEWDRVAYGADGLPLKRR